MNTVYKFSTEFSTGVQKFFSVAIPGTSNLNNNIYYTMYVNSLTEFKDNNVTKDYDPLNFDVDEYID